MGLISKLVSVTRVPHIYQCAQCLLTDTRLTERVLREGLQHEAGMRVLDLGCGPGQFAGLFRDEDYLGIDISPEYIDRARKLHPTKRFQLMNATEIGSLNERFDRAMVMGVFHHMPDADVTDSLRSLRNTLNPGGFCFVAEAIWPTNRFDFAGWLLRRLDRGAHVRTVARWLELFQEFGVRDQVTAYNRLLPYMTCRLDLSRPKSPPTNA